MVETEMVKDLEEKNRQLEKEIEHYRNQCIGYTKIIRNNNQRIGEIGLCHMYVMDLVRRTDCNHEEIKNNIIRSIYRIKEIDDNFRE